MREKLFLVSPSRKKMVTSFSSLSIPMRRIVRNDDVAILFAKFFLCVLFHLFGFSSETDNEILSIFFRERRENVACRD